jgi:hypothetical protein
LLITKLFITYHLPPMTEATFNTRLQQLIAQVENHPQKEEILALALQQLADDTYEVQQN